LNSSKPMNSLRQHCARSGSLDFPAPSATLSVTRRVLEGLPMLVSEPTSPILPTLPPPKPSPSALPSSCSTLPPLASPGLPGLRSSPELFVVSIRTGFHQPPLLGFAPIRGPRHRHHCRSVAIEPDLPPLHRPRPRRPLPRKHCCLRFGARVSRLALPVPTSWFRTTAPVCSADRSVFQDLCADSRLRRIRGLVASRCRSWGSSRFALRPGGVGSLHRRPLLDVCTCRSRGCLLLAMRSYPSKDSPRSRPYCVSAADSLLMFTFPQHPPHPNDTVTGAARHEEPREVASSGPFSELGSVPPSTVSSVRAAYPPWALIPSKVLRSLVSQRRSPKRSAFHESRRSTILSSSSPFPPGAVVPRAGDSPLRSASP